MTSRQQQPDPDRLVRVGRVAKPHGIKGELKIIPYGEPEDFLSYPELFFTSPDDELTESLKVIRCRPQGRQLIVQLDGLDDRSSAEEFAGREVWVDKEYLAVLAEDEFYWHEMVGLRVVTENGRDLGRVEALFATGGHDVLVVRGRGSEHLIPARREFILDTDRQVGTLTVAEVPGLFDLND